MSGRYPGGYEGDWDSGDPLGPRDSGGNPRQHSGQQEYEQQGYGGQGYREGSYREPAQGGVWGSDAPLPGDDERDSRGRHSPIRNGGWDEGQLPPRSGSSRNAEAHQERPGNRPEGTGPAESGRVVIRG